MQKIYSTPEEKRRHNYLKFKEKLRANPEFAARQKAKKQEYYRKKLKIMKEKERFLAKKAPDLLEKINNIGREALQKINLHSKELALSEQSKNSRRENYYNNHYENLVKSDYRPPQNKKMRDYTIEEKRAYWRENSRLRRLKQIKLREAYLNEKAKSNTKQKSFFTKLINLFKEHYGQ